MLYVLPLTLSFPGRNLIAKARNVGTVEKDSLLSQYFCFDPFLFFGPTSLLPTQ